MLDGNDLRAALAMIIIGFVVLLDDDCVIWWRWNVEAHDNFVAWRLVRHLVDGGSRILRKAKYLLA